MTIKLDSSLCKEARHRAIDEGLSLSGLIRKLLSRELAEKPEKIRGTLLDLLGDKRTVVLDDASTDGTAGLRDSHPGVEWIRHEIPL